MQLPLKFPTGKYRPSGIPRINWVNPITAGMTACFLVGETGKNTVDLVGGKTYSATGTGLSPQNTPDGSALATPALSASGIYVTGANVKPVNKVSVFTRVFANTDQTGGNRFIYNCSNAANGSTHGYGLAYGNGTGFLFTAGNGTTFAQAVCGTTAIANTAYSLLGTFDGSNIRAYMNGRLNDTVALSGTLDYTTNPIIFNYDNLGTIGSSSFVGAINIVMVWNRVLSAAEAAYLNNSPYDFLIYPEDEIAALMTGPNLSLSAGQATTTSAGSTIATVIVTVATGGTAPYTYQWYRSTSSGFVPGGGNIVGGATSRTLNDTGLSNGTTYYYKNVVTDNAAATATSNQTSATPTALSNGTAVVSQAVNTTANLTLSDALGGTPPYTYQWYRSTSSGFTPGAGNIIVGATSQTLNDTGLTNGTTYYYKNVVTDNAANTATSVEVSATPAAIQLIGSQLGHVFYGGFLPAQPAPAIAQGYNTLTFWDDFNSLSTIDVNNTLRPGFNWYVQSLVLGTYPTNTKLIFPSTCFSVGGSVLTYTPNTPLGGSVTGGNIFSAGWTGTGDGFVGNTIAPTGWYAECRMAYDPTISQPGHTWFPAFWMWDKGIMYSSSINTFNGERFTELDIYEAIPTGTPNVPNQKYVDWDWSSLSAVVSNTNSSLGVPVLDKKFHTYGVLWVPQARNGGTGLIKRYVDGVHIAGGDVEYSSSTISAQAGVGATTGWLSGLDVSTRGFTVQLQTGEGWPIYVDYVQIWQP